MITSPQNPRVKDAIRLRDRRHRERAGAMLVEGYAELDLALESGASPQTLFVCPELSRGGPQAALEQSRARGAEIVEVSRPVFEKLAYRENPDGWLAVVPIIRRALDDLTFKSQPLLVVAESIEKPGNLGAILRSADAAGADGLVLCDPTTDPHNPNVVRASKGTVFSVPVVEASSAEALAWLRKRKIRVVAATPRAEQLYTGADLRGPVALAVGTEKEGLTSAWLQAADLAVRIPMRGRVNSLNVATAAALMLFESVRQRQPAAGRSESE